MSRTPQSTTSTEPPDRAGAELPVRLIAVSSISQIGTTAHGGGPCSLAEHLGQVLALPHGFFPQAVYVGSQAHERTCLTRYVEGVFRPQAWWQSG